ncbi:uncharacterized protein PITG_10771 [Phytophthora infestans T30-4]|uniref:Uncharacterized protein n=1 Tax=Phytophthora infestans (strain T30-4) TaxID=403677 RepID=D0NH19_PHYIT|nr:uncharacterized protein PITG_10771 [Phytophthora infestans T30-4]EEY58658.1 hypothetical protein PITG_10771 [Phytophthora infestans T30-4]|eukprot:XP_002901602.1 hypothetical protein PITG_10771 [Phytophthora infestans T30-4]
MATGKIKVTKHERGKKWRQLLPPILVDAGWLLKLAADLLVLEAITPELCYKCSLHTMKFHARAIQMKDMPVGE